MRTAARTLARPASRNASPAPAKSVAKGAAAKRPSARPAAPPRSNLPPPPVRPVNGAPRGLFGAQPPAPAPTGPVRKITFRMGDKAVHPQHGVGEVTAIERKEINGTVLELYVLRILDNGMKVMVSKTAAHQVGLREVMTKSDAEGVIDTMRAREVAVDLQPWSRRFRAYTEMIKSGSPYEVAKVLRDMYRLKFDKDLSFGERRLLDTAKSLLFKELALAKKTSEAELVAEINDIFKA